MRSTHLLLLLATAATALPAPYATAAADAAYDALGVLAQSMLVGPADGRAAGVTPPRLPSPLHAETQLSATIMSFLTVTSNLSYWVSTTAGGRAVWRTAGLRGWSFLPAIHVEGVAVISDNAVHTAYQVGSLATRCNTTYGWASRWVDRSRNGVALLPCSNWVKGTGTYGGVSADTYEDTACSSAGAVRSNVTANVTWSAKMYYSSGTARMLGGEGTIKASAAGRTISVPYKITVLTWDTAEPAASIFVKPAICSTPAQSSDTASTPAGQQSSDSPTPSPGTKSKSSYTAGIVIGTLCGAGAAAAAVIFGVMYFINRRGRSAAYKRVEMNNPDIQEAHEEGANASSAAPSLQPMPNDAPALSTPQAAAPPHVPGEVPKLADV